MNMQQKTLTKAAPQPSFIPVQTGILQRKCACGQHTVTGGECEECRQKHEGMLQRTAVAAASVNGVPPIVHAVLSSPGQPLDTGTRALMETRFRHDFSQVRVHTDAKAAESAQAVNALAYTVGQDVVFGAGRYTPGKFVGKRLLAHELTHVVQQEGAPLGTLHGISSPTSLDEQKATTIGDGIVQTMPYQSQVSTYMRSSGQSTLQRQVDAGAPSDSGTVLDASTVSGGVTTAPDAGPTPVVTQTPDAGQTADAGVQRQQPRAAPGTTGTHGGLSYTVYENEVRVGGSRAWRNNNPGNLVRGQFAQDHGAIGSDGTFAVFPDEGTGMDALVALLNTDTYQNLTIREAINRYAPPSENDTNAYVNIIRRQTGLDPNRRMSSLSNDELMSVARVIRVVEGWTPGQSYTCANTNAATLAWIRNLLGCAS